MRRNAGSATNALDDAAGPAEGESPYSAFPGPCGDELDVGIGACILRTMSARAPRDVRAPLRTVAKNRHVNDLEESPAGVSSAIAPCEPMSMPMMGPVTSRLQQRFRGGNRHLDRRERRQITGHHLERRDRGGGVSVLEGGARQADLHRGADQALRREVRGDGDDSAQRSRRRGCHP